MSLIICAFNSDSTTVCSEDRAGRYDEAGNFIVTREGQVKSIQVTPNIIFATTGLVTIAEALLSIVRCFAGLNFHQMAETIPQLARQLMKDARAAYPQFVGQNEPRLVGVLTGWDNEKKALRSICWHWERNFAPTEAPSDVGTCHIVFSPCVDSYNRANYLLQHGASLPDIFTTLAGEFPTVGTGLTMRTVVARDCESWTVGSAAPGWTLGAGAQLNTANDFVQSGSKSLKITHTGPNNSVSRQTVNVNGGQVYVILGWIKTDAITNVSGHGAYINIAAGSGVTGFTILTKFGAADQGLTATPTIGLQASGSAVPFTFLECYFIPNTSGQISVGLQLISNNAASAWFDTVFLYPFQGKAYSGLTSGATYHLYPYIDISTGNVVFANGTPPGTSPSDTLAMQTQLDGRVPIEPIAITMPSAGGGFSGTGGGSGTCPEIYEPVYIRRYSQTGELTFEGWIKAGEIQHGHFDGAANRGDFLKGYSFTQKRDVFRPVQRRMIVPCHGWSIVNGRRVTCCEMVYVSGQWVPAWKAPGAVFDTKSSYKIMIEVRADEDDEHNYYCGDLLIHNGVILGC
jgi:hypothetical protein